MIPTANNCNNCFVFSCSENGKTRPACSRHLTKSALEQIDLDIKMRNLVRESGAPMPKPAAAGIEAMVCDDIAKRQQLGILKYGQTVAENPLDLMQWLQHAYEECLDQAVYLKRAMAELKAKTYIHGRMDKDGS